VRRTPAALAGKRVTEETAASGRGGREGREANERQRAQVQISAHGREARIMKAAGLKTA
jgi:hypothetical protein